MQALSFSFGYWNMPLRNLSFSFKYFNILQKMSRFWIINKIVPWFIPSLPYATLKMYNIYLIKFTRLQYNESQKWIVKYFTSVKWVNVFIMRRSRNLALWMIHLHKKNKVTKLAILLLTLGEHDVNGMHLFQWITLFLLLWKC